jgi:hypothetical protein
MSNARIKNPKKQAKNALIGFNPDSIPIANPKTKGKKKLFGSMRRLRAKNEKNHPAITRRIHIHTYSIDLTFLVGTSIRYTSFFDLILEISFARSDYKERQPFSNFLSSVNNDFGAAIIAVVE